MDAPDPREAYRYTPYFCEENVWWLARALRDGEPSSTRLEVWMLSNASQSIVLADQRAAAEGALMAWDYHVVLHLAAGPRDLVFDFDTRLPFPVATRAYLQRSFPDQAALPERLRSRVRIVPADDYLARFSSDRSHMRGRLAASAFPAYPAIQTRVDAVTLAEYLDMQTRIPGTRLMSIAELAASVMQELDSGGGD